MYFGSPKAVVGRREVTDLSSPWISPRTSVGTIEGVDWAENEEGFSNRPGCPRVKKTLS